MTIARLTAERDAALEMMNQARDVRDRAIVDMEAAEAALASEIEVSRSFSRSAKAFEDRALAAESALAEAREEAERLRSALVEIESAMVWALDKSPEACHAMVKESTPWRMKVRAALSGGKP